MKTGTREREIEERQQIQKEQNVERFSDWEL